MPASSLAPRGTATPCLASTPSRLLSYLLASLLLCLPCLALPVQAQSSDDTCHSSDRETPCEDEGDDEDDDDDGGDDDGDGEEEFPDQRFSGEAVAPWEEYGKFIQARSTLSTQGPTLFGDDVNLHTGTLSFAVTDIDLPGNNALPVQLRRVMAVGEDANDAVDPSMGGWGLDLPNVSGVYGTT